MPDVRYYLDADRDQMPDGWEAEWNFPTDRFDDYMNIDSDADKLTDAEEFRYMTSPRNGDTDGDGIDDSYEVGQRLDPLDPSDAGVDHDNDGVSTLQEYRDGTDPYDSNSFKAPSASGGGGGGGGGAVGGNLLAFLGMMILILTTRRFFAPLCAAIPARARWDLSPGG